MNIICRIFGHNYVPSFLWHDKLKVNISTPTCVRCGYRNHDSYSKNYDDFKRTACKGCGGWICHSGICVSCD